MYSFMSAWDSLFKKRGSFFRRMLRAVAWTAGVCVALLLAGLALLQTGPVRRAVLSSVSDYLSDPDRDLRITFRGLHGFLPFSLRVERITAADRQGVFVRVKDAAMELRFRRLVRGEIVLRKLSAERIALHRFPDFSEQRKSRMFRPDMLRTELPVLPGVSVESLSVNRLVLEHGKDRYRSEFSVNGRLERGDDEAALAELILEGREQETGRIAFRAEYGPGGEWVTLSASGILRPGGFFLPRSEFFGERDIRFSVNGKGRIREWQGTCRVSHGGKKFLSAKAEVVDGKEQPMLHVRGDLFAGRIVSVLQQQATGRIPDDFRLPFDLKVARVPGARTVFLRSAEISVPHDTAPASLSLHTGPDEFDLSADIPDLSVLANAGFPVLKGKVMITAAVQGEKIDTEVEVRVLDFTPLFEQTGWPAAGRLELNMTGSGTLSDPDLDLSV